MSESPSIAQNSITDYSRGILGEYIDSVLPFDFSEKELNYYFNKVDGVRFVAEADIEETSEFLLNDELNQKCTKMGIVVKAPKEMRKHVDKLFSKNHQIAIRPSYDLKKCDVLIKWGSVKDYCFELNADLIRIICGIELNDLPEKEKFYIPIAFLSGYSVTNHIFEISIEDCYHLTDLLNAAHEYWSPELIPEGTKNKFIDLNEVLKANGAYPLHGRFMENYLRARTYLDKDAVRKFS